MTKQALDGVQIDTGFEQVGGKAMAQRMNAAARGEPSGIAGGAVEPLDRLLSDLSVAGAVREDPAPGAEGAPVQAKRFEQARREDRVAIPAALAGRRLPRDVIRWRKPFRAGCGRATSGNERTGV